jgi:phosphoribosylanthranilate isomerase
LKSSLKYPAARLFLPRQSKYANSIEFSFDNVGMMLKTRVKVGNISNLSDARYCAGMGVDMLGYAVIPGQEGYVPEALYQDLRGWISGPATVAELYGITADTDLNPILDGYLPDLVEIFAGDLHLLENLQGPEIIVTVRDIQDVDILRSAKKQIRYVIVNQENRNLIKQLRPDFEVLLAVDPTQEVSPILEQWDISGIALRGTAEERPGFKDYDNIARVLEELEV